MAEIKMELTFRRRFWFNAAGELLAYSCAALSLFSMRAAHWLSDKGSGFLARHGFKIYTVPTGGVVKQSRPFIVGETQCVTMAKKGVPKKGK